MEKARHVRRAAKGSLTRSIGTVTNLIDAQRSWEEIQNALVGLSKSFEALVVKHEEYTLQLNDEEFDDAEIWMNNCTREFNQCRIVKAPERLDL
jgi:hypothetical protein